ncbi:hypothetical protein [Streptosporangium sp. NPDC004631]
MRFLSFDANSSWVSYSTDTPGVYVFARLVPDERGELVVRDLMVSSDDQLTGSDLRGLSVGKIEAMVNGRPFLKQHLAAKSADDPHVSALRGGLVEAPERRREGKRSPLALPRPDGVDPEDFYKRVAGVYRLATMETARPAVRISEASGVPVATVRRWVNEARRRGFLPKGQPGRAG